MIFCRHGHGSPNIQLACGVRTSGGAFQSACLDFSAMAFRADILRGKPFYQLRRLTRILFFRSMRKILFFFSGLVIQRMQFAVKSFPVRLVLRWFITAYNNNDS